MIWLLIQNVQIFAQRKSWSCAFLKAEASRYRPEPTQVHPCNTRKSDRQSRQHPRAFLFQHFVRSDRITGLLALTTKLHLFLLFFSSSFLFFFTSLRFHSLKSLRRGYRRRPPETLILYDVLLRFCKQILLTAGSGSIHAYSRVELQTNPNSGRLNQTELHRCDIAFLLCPLSRSPR